MENKNGKYPIYGSGGIIGWANEYLCEKENVIIGRKGSINKPIFVDTPFWNVDTAFGLIANREILDSKYLYYFCLSFDFEKLSTTVTIPSLTKNNLLNIKFNVPSLAKQRKIVKKLDKIQEIIKKYQQELIEFEKLSKSIFIEMFQKNYNIISWEYKKITEVYQIIDGDRGKNYPKSEELFEKEYCLFLNTGNVTKNGFNFEKKVFITKEKDEILKNGKLERNDIVLTTRGTIGNIAYYDNTIEYSNIRINSGMVILRKIKEINPCYFIAFFKEKNTYMKLVSGSAQPQMPISKLKEFKLLLPPIELQNQFAERIKMIEKSKIEIQKSIEETQKLFDSLMEKYFG